MYFFQECSGGSIERMYVKNNNKILFNSRDPIYYYNKGWDKWFKFIAKTLSYYIIKIINPCSQALILRGGWSSNDADGEDFTSGIYSCKHQA